MKKLFTLVAMVSLSVGAANAQSKAAATKAEVDAEKTSVKGSTTENVDEKHVSTVNQRSASAKRVNGAAFLTREQLEARMKEQSTNAKTKKVEEK
ncbi:MAG: hypothetical protein H6601_01220 [Flavobacteriales bacterium]|nr:hypothetical protein [Flavobacteriales bacterium]